MNTNNAYKKYHKEILSIHNKIDRDAAKLLLSELIYDESKNLVKDGKNKNKTILSYKFMSK